MQSLFRALNAYISSSISEKLTSNKFKAWLSGIFPTSRQNRTFCSDQKFCLSLNFYIYFLRIKKTLLNSTNLLFVNFFIYLTLTNSTLVNQYTFIRFPLSLSSILAQSFFYVYLEQLLDST